MKILIIILNIVSVLSIIAWAGWMFLEALGAGYGSATGGSRGDNVSLLIFVAAIVIVIASIIFSHVNSAKFILLWALAPVIFWLGVGIYFAAKAFEWKKIGEEVRQNHIADLRKISQDYTRSKTLNPYGSDTFLTYDATNQEIKKVYVTNGEMIVDVLPFAKVSGSTLEVFHESYMTKEGKEEMMAYKNKEGKTIYDNYTVVYKPGQKKEDYHLSR